jgi:hypothetical protein
MTARFQHTSLRCTMKTSAGRLAALFASDLGDLWFLQN